MIGGNSLTIRSSTLGGSRVDAGGVYVPPATWLEAMCIAMGARRRPDGSGTGVSGVSTADPQAPSTEFGRRALSFTIVLAREAVGYRP